jgi:hypothetical protein
LPVQEVLQLEEQLLAQPQEQPDGLQLQLELPAFPHPVLYQHLQSALAAAAQLNASAAQRDGLLEAVHDPEVGLDNPAELKAQKLARSLNRGRARWQRCATAPLRHCANVPMCYCANVPLQA